MVKITVIIPVYNMQKYIEKCLDSIIRQSLKEIEIICIDDGSTDQTEKIILKYQKRYSNIFYKKQTNQGAGVARNLGIACAKGKYIAFMDADDFYLDTGSMEYLFHTAEKFKIQICGGSRCICHENIVTTEGVRKELIFAKEGIVKTKDFDGFSAYQQFIYNKDFIRKNHLKFPDYRRCQDVPFFVSALSLVDEIYVCRICSYCYRKEHKVVVFDERKAIDYLKGMRDALKITLDHDMRMMYTNILNDFFGEPTGILYKYIADGNSEILEVSREIREYIKPEKLVKDKYRNKKVKLLEEDRIHTYVVDVREEWNQFFDEAKRQKILIFGAGTVGRKVYRVFEKKGVPVEAFVVSDIMQNVAEIDGIKVCKIDDYCNKASEYFVVTAVYGYLQEEINLLLEKKGFRRRKQIDMEELCFCEEQITH